MNSFAAARLAFQFSRGFRQVLAHAHPHSARSAPPPLPSVRPASGSYPRPPGQSRVEQRIEHCDKRLVLLLVVQRVKNRRQIGPHLLYTAEVTHGHLATPFQSFYVNSLKRVRVMMWLRASLLALSAA